MGRRFAYTLQCSLYDYEKGCVAWVDLAKIIWFSSKEDEDWAFYLFLSFVLFSDTNLAFSFCHYPELCLRSF